MTEGPGRHDKHALRIMREELATCVVVIVLGGRRGPGVSVKTSGASREEAMRLHMKVPGILRALAQHMDESIDADLAEADVIDLASKRPPDDTDGGMSA